MGPGSETKDGKLDLDKQSVADLLRTLLNDNRELTRQVTDLQDRRGDLVEYGRMVRKAVVALGGEDPGSPSDFKREG